MAQNVTARTDKDHRDALEEMVQNDEADSVSEAVRQTSQAELARRGYLSRNSTTLRQALQEGYKFLFYSALIWLAFSFSYPVGARLPAGFLFISGAILYGLDALLAEYEPKVSEWLSGVFGRDVA